MRREADMQAEHRTDPGAGLRLFNTLLGIGNLLLMVMTVVSMSIAWAVLSGRGTVKLDAEFDQPYTVEFADGSAIDASGGGASWHDLPPGDHRRALEESVSVRTTVDVGPDDTDARVVLAAGVAARLALTWLGLFNVRRIVRSALDGQPFHADNVGRLRWLAVAVLALPVVTTVEHVVLEGRLDIHPPVDVVTSGPGWWVYLMVGAGVLALAEIFREGARLRDLEATTI
jgi:hypothetical protein